MSNNCGHISAPVKCSTTFHTSECVHVGSSNASSNDGKGTFYCSRKNERFHNCTVASGPIQLYRKEDYHESPCRKRLRSEENHGKLISVGNCHCYSCNDSHSPHFPRGDSEYDVERIRNDTLNLHSSSPNRKRKHSDHEAHGCRHCGSDNRKYHHNQKHATQTRNRYSIEYNHSKHDQNSCPNLRHSSRHCRRSPSTSTSGSEDNHYKHDQESCSKYSGLKHSSGGKRKHRNRSPSTSDSEDNHSKHEQDSCSKYSHLKHSSGGKRKHRNRSPSTSDSEDNHSKQSLSRRKDKKKRQYRSPSPSTSNSEDNYSKREHNSRSRSKHPSRDNKQRSSSPSPRRNRDLASRDNNAKQEQSSSRSKHPSRDNKKRSSSPSPRRNRDLASRDNNAKQEQSSSRSKHPSRDNKKRSSSPSPRRNRDLASRDNNAKQEQSSSRSKHPSRDNKQRSSSPSSERNRDLASQDNNAKQEQSSSRSKHPSRDNKQRSSSPSSERNRDLASQDNNAKQEQSSSRSKHPSRDNKQRSSSPSSERNCDLASQDNNAKQEQSSSRSKHPSRDNKQRSSSPSSERNRDLVSQHNNAKHEYNAGSEDQHHGRDAKHSKDRSPSPSSRRNRDLDSPSKEKKENNIDKKSSQYRYLNDSADRNKQDSDGSDVGDDTRSLDTDIYVPEDTGSLNNEPQRDEKAESVVGSHVGNETSNGNSQIPAQEKYACINCEFNTESNEILDAHVLEKHKQHVTVEQGTEPEDRDAIEKFFKEHKMKPTNAKFKKELKKLKLEEIIIQGNGFCLISAILITLASQGIEKTYNQFCLEVMKEIRDNYRTFYARFATPEDEVVDEQHFFDRCARFFQAGNYGDNLVDICLGATANAIGANLLIFQINDKHVSLTKYKVGRGYSSSVYLYLHFYPSKKNRKKSKNLDAHYNCYLTTDYYLENLDKIQTQVVQRDSSTLSVDMASDHLLAQKLQADLNCWQNKGGSERYVKLFCILYKFVALRALYHRERERNNDYEHFRKVKKTIK